MKLFFFYFSFLSIILMGQNKFSSNTSLNKITTNDDYEYIAVNQLKMWIGNNGMGSHNPILDSHGLLWPGGENAVLNLAFADGLIWGGHIGDSLYVNGNTYRYGLQAGKILENGIADNPCFSKYRVYKITKNWESLFPGPTRDRYQKDYLEWPGDEGAPFYDENNDGKFTSGIDKPLFIGDEVLWCVMNDMDSSRTLYTFGTMPIGLEIQLTVYGYTHSSLENVLIKNYTVINKSVNTIDSMFFSYWADTDIGNTHDDYVGCDSLINLGYCYNADPDDNNYYGYLPPAVGYLLLEGAKIKGTYYDSAKYNYNWVQGLKDLKMTSFSFSHSSYPVCSSLPLNVVQYNRLNGLICHGVSYINPIDGNATKFPFYGNPVDSTGWYMGYQNSLPPDDVTLLINSGPVTMAPGDTQEVAIAIIAALGSDHLESITRLKETAQTVQYFYDNFSPEFVNTSYRKPLPEYYCLSQNYPNPFNPETRVDYDLPISGYTTLIVYDILGNKISTLVNEEKKAGSYSVYFDGSKLSSGVYIYSIQVRDFVKSRKMILLR